MNYNQPDKEGHFDKFGGKYIPETLVPAIKELERMYMLVRDDKCFQQELEMLKIK